ncbi:MucBP domain-containing protein [Culicoidibacter larvae]|uniref:MucBP domain-containing protein n=1 Tax=Culicoidibacter larvae TaxID=2579976 RepID=A0A5R8QBG8_9FIRM|nr:MucBP domain-containing protein [Culicoidibacter larvae]TLG72965.1 hypothetical protein FEZ08_07925 [Culicoidibacter larvae]
MLVIINSTSVFATTENNVISEDVTVENVISTNNVQETNDILGENIEVIKPDNNLAITQQYLLRSSLTIPDYIQLTYDPANAAFPYVDTNPDYLIVDMIYLNKPQNVAYYLSVDYQLYLATGEKQIHLIYVKDNAIVDILDVTYGSIITSETRTFIVADGGGDQLNFTIDEPNKGTSEVQILLTAPTVKINFVDENGEQISAPFAFNSLAAMQYNISPPMLSGYSYVSTTGNTSGFLSRVVSNMDYIVLANETYGYKYMNRYYDDGTVDVWLENLYNADLSSPRYNVLWGETVFWTKADWTAAGLPRMNGGSVITDTIVQSDEITFIYQKDPVASIDNNTAASDEIVLPNTGLYSGEATAIGLLFVSTALIALASIKYLAKHYLK